MEWLGLLLLLSALLGRLGEVPVVPFQPAVGIAGQAVCSAGHPAVAFDGGATGNVVVHEYLHAYDCWDDGVMNGSPYPYPEHFAGSPLDPAHHWVYWALANPEHAVEIVNR